MLVKSISQVTYTTLGPITAVCAVLPALYIVMVALRFYTRHIQKAGAVDG